MLIRQTLAYLPAQLIGPLAQFANAIILTHWLDAAEYGHTMLVFASQELVFLVCLSWWTFYMMRYSGSMSGPGRRQAFLRTEAAVIAATAAIQLVLTAVLIAISEPGAGWAMLAASALFTVTRSHLNLISERARIDGLIKAYTLIQIGAPLGGLLVTLAAMRLYAAEPITVLLAFAAVQGAIGMGVAARLGMLIRPGPVDGDILAAARDFGVPILFSNAFNWLAGNAIRYIVQFYRGAGDLGLLSVGWGLAGRLSGLAAMVVTAAAYPLAVKEMEAGRPDEAKRQLSLNSALLLGIIAPATAGVIAITDPLVRLLIAAEFQAMTIAILPWALIGASIRNLRMHGCDQLYLLFERPQTMLILDIYEAGAAILGGILGVLFAGLIGAVIGTVIATTVVTLGDFVYLHRRYGFRFRAGDMLRILAATSLMTLAILALPRLGFAVTPTLLGLAGAVLFGMAVYALAIAALFPGEARQAIGKARGFLARG